MVQNAADKISLLDRVARTGVADDRLFSLFDSADFEKINPAATEATPSDNSNSADNNAPASPAEDTSSSDNSPDVSTNLGERTLVDRALVKAVRQGLIIFGMMWMFTAMYSYGRAVAYSTALEKGSRVMEILLCSCKPLDLIFGKIFGIGLVGITQTVLIAGAAVVAFGIQVAISLIFLPRFSPVIGQEVEIFVQLLGLLLLIVLFSALGFFLYAGLYAAFGSLANSEEDVSHFMMPIGYFTSLNNGLSYLAVFNPDSPWIAAGSYFPFFTPTLMLVQVGAESAAWWELILSIGLMVVSILVLTWLSARVYRAGVLLYGQKPRLRRVLKLMFENGG